MSKGMTWLNLIFMGLMAGAAQAEIDAKSAFKKLNWNGVEVVYIEDNRFPTYDIDIYFADGALGDKSISGMTNRALNLIEYGTSEMSQMEISKKLDFLGTNLHRSITHEFTTVSISGLAKDIDEGVGDVCTLFRQANYPKDVIQKELDKDRTYIMNLVSSPASLAERAYREISLANTPYGTNVSGKLVDLSRYNSENLRERMNELLTKVKKRIYLTGPHSVLSVEKVLKEKCAFSGEASFVRSTGFVKKDRQKKSRLVFVPVPDQNQVQVKIGRFVNANEVNDRDLHTMASEVLGGGFISRLMHEVRVKRGLTYSIGSYISTQKEYGRAGISTFTKNETINRLIEVIEGTLDEIRNKGLTKNEAEATIKSLKGSYPFKFELNSDFLSQLAYLDHIGVSYDELFNFHHNIEKYNEKDITRVINQIFDRNQQIIFILGDKSIEKDLKKLSKKFGKLEVFDYHQFL